MCSSPNFRNCSNNAPQLVYHLQCVGIKFYFHFSKNGDNNPLNIRLSQSQAHLGDCDALPDAQRAPVHLVRHLSQARDPYIILLIYYSFDFI